VHLENLEVSEHTGTLTNLLLCEWPGESDCWRILHRLSRLDVPESFQTDTR